MTKVLPLLTALTLLSPLAAAQQVQTLQSGGLKVTLTPTQPDANGWYRAGKLSIQQAGAEAKTVESRQLGGAVVSQISPDGCWMSVIHPYDGYAQLWDTATAERKYTFLAHDKKSYYARLAAFSPDSSRVVFYAYPNELSLWDTATGQRVKLLSDVRKGGWSDADSDAVFSPDGKTFVVIGGGAGAQLFDTKTGDLLRTYDRPWEFYGSWHGGGFWRGAIAAAFSPDSKNVVVLYAGGQARLYGLDSNLAQIGAVWATGKLKPYSRYWSGKLTFDGQTLSGKTPNHWADFSLKFGAAPIGLGGKP